MQIGPTAGPAVQDYPLEKMAAKQAEARAVVAASLQTSLNPETRKTAEIRSTTQDLEHISLAFNRKLKFVIDHESKEVLVKVIDSETDKVIKVLPPEELQRLHQRIRETIGFLFDQRV
jgi:flagellar protein FlaG